MNKQKLDELDKLTEKIVETPMGDDDIHFYLPKSKVIKYSELSRYNNIDNLLNKEKDCAFILYEDSPNCGHWTCITKMKGVISYFDSYGKKVDNPLNWTSKLENIKLKQNRKLLSELLNRCPYKVEYNPIKYQSDNKFKDINSCGRHCVFFTKNLLDCDRDLDKYYKFITEIKNESGNTYDEIVSHLINKI